MSKHNYKKRRLKYVFLAFTCATAFAFSGIAAACGNGTSSDDEKDKTTTKEDTQLLKNGNFEFFTIPEKKEGGNEPEYLIKTPDSWTHGGTSSYTMSGIISTSETAWNKITAQTLADTLDLNNKLDSSSSTYLSEYVDYNGMKSTDLLYKNQYEALRTEDDLEEGETLPEDAKDQIENPGTHYVVKERDGKLTTIDGDEVFVDENGEYFLEYEKDEYSKPISNVLMLHNYATSHNGIAQNYSSVDIDLPANTAAEISLWVKTSYLKFEKGETVSQDRGANITVTQTVGTSTLDNFVISCINTEKLINEGKADDKYDGWVQYTVFVNACDFASSTISLQLGLGESGHLTEGYAFFDDVSVTKYTSLDNSESYKAADKDKLENATCNLSSDADGKIFKADSYKRNGSSVADERYSDYFEYYIDLASEHGDDTYSPISFSNVNIKTGYTEEDNYVSSNLTFNTKNLIGFTGVDTENKDNWRLPFNTPLDTSEDLLAFVTTGYTFTKNETNYYDKLNKALGGAVNLPKNENALNNMLVMLSAYGAAYTTSFDLKIEDGGYKIISFWVKTSDMGGNTAATVSITQKDNDDNTASFTVDTTGTVTDIGDEKDIYDGWVQCFFFVNSELEDTDNGYTEFTVKFSFGNTAIKGTDIRSYSNGWVALANMQTLDVSEDVFSYTSGGDTTASLTISEEAEKTTQVFDKAYSNQSGNIKNDLVIPSTYLGVNGGSSAVINNGHVSIPFDEFFNNTDDNGAKFAGLLNKKYFTNDSPYAQTEWYKALIDSFYPTTGTLDAVTAWNEIFGTKSVQPIIINNRTRTSYVEMKGADEKTYTNYLVKDEDGNFVAVEDGAEFDENETYYSLQSVLNYGYIGATQSISADSYATVSVRVKVSANAIAYIYLADTSAGKAVLSFNAPSYSFYYDTEGNVLKEEPKDNATVTEQRANILYTLRDDGLYEDKEGNLYANLWNYNKLYYIENMTYYSEDGKTTYSIDDLVGTETYYDENGNIANHYLVTTEGVKVYEYKDGAYHYIVNGKTQSAVVNTFDVTYSRYNFSGVSEDYVVEIKGSEHTDINGIPQWVTVTFVLHAGSEAKSYRLELWSGKREEYETDGNDENGVVIFDYSYTTISDDSMKSEYEQEIINAYLNALPSDVLAKIDTTGKNIAYFENLAKENGVDVDSIKESYKAHYYTYSLYDSPAFQPFNKEVANDEATGYDYNVSEQSETLAFLQVNEENSYTIFADYSAIDKSVTLNNASSSDTDDTTEESSGSDGSIWLLASSIILVIALVFAIIAIFLKDAIKKLRRNKVTSKNNYDQRKTNRYKRKLHLKQENIVEVDRNDATNDGESVAEDVPAEEVEEPAVENEVEEAPSEEVEEPSAEEPDSGEQE